MTGRSRTPAYLVAWMGRDFGMQVRDLRCYFDIGRNTKMNDTIHISRYEYDVVQCMRAS